jgi:hypothetical protein
MILVFALFIIILNSFNTEANFQGEIKKSEINILIIELTINLLSLIF